MGTCESAQNSVTAPQDLKHQQCSNQGSLARSRDELTTEATSAGTSGSSNAKEKGAEDSIVGNDGNGCHGNQIHHAKYVFSELNKMRKCGHCSDVKIVCHGNVFNLHKLVLSANNDSLKREFSSTAGDLSQREPESTLSAFEGIDPVTMETMLGLMYANGETLTEEKLWQILVKYREMPLFVSFATLLQSNVRDSIAADNAPLLLAQIERFRTNGTMIDIDVFVDSQKIECHRCILAACSGYFLNLFKSNMEGAKDRTVRIRGVAPQIMTLLINFAYTGFLPVDEANVQSLLAASRRFQFKEVQRICVSFLERKLSIENCIDTMRLASKENAVMLAARAKQMAVTKFEELTERPAFLRLHPSELKAILSDELHVDSEERVCDAVLRWLKSNFLAGGRERSDAIEVLECVNLGQLSDHYVKTKLLTDSSTKTIFRKREFQKKYIEKCKHPRRYIESVVFLGESSEKTFRSIVYDPSKKAWYDIPELQNLPIEGVTSDIAAALFWQGELWIVVGGRHHVIFDLSEREWYTNSGICSKIRNKFDFVSVSGHVYILGGQLSDENIEAHKTEYLLDVYRYNSARDIWEVAAQLPQPIFPNSSVECNDKIFVVSITHSDIKGRGNLHQYKPKSNSWTLVSPLPEECFPCQDENQPHCNGLSVHAIFGNIYLYVETTGSFHRYDTQSNNWHALPTMNKLRKGQQSVVCMGKILVFGGRDITSASPVTEIEAFDPIREEWEVIDELPRDFPFARVDSAVTVPNKQLWRTYLT
ncbi:kelch-like protein 41 [Ptychodera flava]|uniref:kelch-like protein 41 n=1 Tax=Ptychodera flava TaxID=63121 RepID=UPI003969DBD2